MPEKNAIAIDAKPALAIMTRDLRWMNAAAISTNRASMKRTTATTTWSISAGEPPVNTTANGLGSVEVEKVTKRLANMPSKNWTINKGHHYTGQNLDLSKPHEGREEAMF